MLPSTQLTRQVVISKTLNLPNTVNPGRTITIPIENNIEKLAIGHSSFSTIPNTNIWLGVVGLYQGEVAVIHGTLKSQPAFLNLGHPEVHYFKQLIQVDKVDLNQGKKLRIPASTWNKVNDRFAEQKQRDRELMNSLLGSINGKLGDDCWRPPLESRRVSRFASPRRLPSGQSYYHSGVDLRARKGTPILASGPGQVAFADHMIVPGNMVVVDHGGGLYTRYMHLSDLKVKTGAKIKTGDLIGLAGATGRVEGPHLHWEVVWKGNHANPHSFLRAWEQLCDRG